MEKLSRVKKYEDLRKSIEMDNNIDATVQDESLAASENLLKSFDSSVFGSSFTASVLAFPPWVPDDPQPVRKPAVMAAATTKDITRFIYFSSS